MAGAGLIALIDDIAGAATKLSATASDVGTLAAMAGKKTAGVVGDDLALNANQLIGIDPSRELPIVWEVAKGSLRNKAVLVPAAVGISAATPWAITPLLMVGGAYLCFEGVEKIAHRVLHREEHGEGTAPAPDAPVDFVALEQEKVKGAIRTDFILSAEIVAITLGSVADRGLLMQFGVLSAVGLVMTVGVYGLVGGIVKMDDVGLHYSTRTGAAGVAGRLLLRSAPWLLKALSSAGTAAMFLVGGGIVLHGLPPLEAALRSWVTSLAGGGLLAGLVSLVGTVLFGVLAGAVTLPAFLGVGRLVDAIKTRRTPAPPAAQ